MMCYLMAATYGEFRWQKQTSFCADSELRISGIHHKEKGAVTCLVRVALEQSPSRLRQCSKTCSVTTCGMSFQEETKTKENQIK